MTLRPEYIYANLSQGSSSIDRVIYWYRYKSWKRFESFIAMPDGEGTGFLFPNPWAITVDVRIRTRLLPRTQELWNR